MLGAAEMVVVGLCWAGLLSGFIAGRPRFFLPRRVRDESAISSRVRDQESAVSGHRGPGRPRRVHGLCGRVRDLDTVVTAGSTEPALDAYMPAVEHIEKFIAWAVVSPDGRARQVRDRYDGMFARYLEWTMCHYVVPLPEKTWQTLIKAHSQVCHKREPMKDPATGRILRKSSGAPERQTIYTIRPPRAEPAMPGKVPVADVVKCDPVLTRRRASQAQHTQQPLPGADASSRRLASSEMASEAPRRKAA